MLLATVLLAFLFALVRLAAARPNRHWPTALTLLCAAAAGLAIAAPQILPFVEYLRLSVVAEQPTRFETLYEPRALALLFFPDLAGTPVGHHEFAPNLVKTGYQEQNGYCVGPLPLLCALGACLLGVLRTRFALFPALALVIAVIVWNVGGLGTLVGPFVSFGLIPAGRFYSQWSLAAALLAAWLVQRLSDGRERGRGALVLGCALALYAAALWGAAHFVSSNAAERGLDAAGWWRFAARHLTWISAWYWGGALALAWLAHARSDRMRWTAAGVLCGAQLAMTAPVFGNFVPITPDPLVLPSTPELEALRAVVGDERVLFFGEGDITPDANAILGVRSMTHYDAISIYAVQAAATPMFGGQTYAAQLHKGTSTGLRVFGVRYVSTRTQWLPIDTFSTQPPSADDVTPYAALLRTGPGADVPSVEIDGIGARQVFTAPRNGLAGLVVHFGADPEASSTPLSIALHAANGELVARRELELADLRDFHAGRLECVLGFPPIADSAGQKFALRVRVLDDTAPRPRLLGLGPDWALRLAQAGLASRPRKRRSPSPAGPEEPESGARDELPFVVDLMFGEALVHRGDIGGHSLFEVAGSRGRAWIVSGVLDVGSPGEAYERLTLDGFDPYQEVILEGFPGREPDLELDALLEPLCADPQRSRWRARVDREAFLVVAQPHYPGWLARLDGQAVPLLRVNYAFSAVELPRGEHEVELAYEPRSVKLGFALGALGWLALALAWLRLR